MSKRTAVLAVLSLLAVTFQITTNGTNISGSLGDNDFANLLDFLATVIPGLTSFGLSLL